MKLSRPPRNCRFCKCLLKATQKVTCTACIPERIKQHNAESRKKQRAALIQKNPTVTYSQLVDVFRANGMFYNY